MPPKPIGKYRTKRRIDAAAINPFSLATGDGGLGVAQVAPPAPPTIAVPADLALSTALYSAVTPAARISATWTGLESYDLERYAVQISDDVGFADSTTATYRTGVNQTSIVIDNLRVDTTYYVRIAVIVGDTQGDWCDAESITTLTDTVAPGVPTGAAADFFNGGDLRLTWTNPTDLNFKDVEIIIWDSASKLIQYTSPPIYSATGTHVWTAGQNLTATAGVGDPSVFVEFRSRNWNNTHSAAVTATATLARPGTPTDLVSSWASDTGAAGPDCTARWTALAGYRYWLTVDGTARALGFTDQFTETLDANRSDHAGTPDPVLSLSLVAVDQLGQTSTIPATATATNAAPATPTATLIQGAVSGLYASVTSTPPADFLAYEYVFKRDGSTVATITSPASTVRYEMQGVGDDGYHSWTVVIRQKDAFGQFSATVTPSAVAFEALTLAGLRAQAAYTDSTGASATTLAVLKDGITTTGGISYAA